MKEGFMREISKGIMLKYLDDFIEKNLYFAATCE